MAADLRTDLLAVFRRDGGQKTLYRLSLDLGYVGQDAAMRRMRKALVALIEDGIMIGSRGGGNRFYYSLAAPLQESLL